MFVHRLIAAIALTLCSHTAFAESDTPPSNWDILDTHGINVKIGSLEARETLNLEVRLNSMACALLKEQLQPPVSNWREWSLLNEEDHQKILETIGQCWRWYDHLFAGQEYEPDMLRLPEFVGKVEYVRGIPYTTNYTGKCVDGYYLTYRPKEKNYWWHFWSGRTFKAKCGRDVHVKLRYSHNGVAEGSVFLDSQELLIAKPGADSFDGEVTRRLKRSQLRKHVEFNTFQTVSLRFQKLCGPMWYEVSTRAQNADGEFACILRYRLSPLANHRAVESLQQTTRQANRISITEKEQQTVGVRANTDGDLLVIQGAAAVRLRSCLDAEWRAEWLKSMEREDGMDSQLQIAIPVDAVQNFSKPNPVVYALSLASALVPLALPDNEAAHVLIDSLLAESEISVDFH